MKQHKPGLCRYSRKAAVYRWTIWGSACVWGTLVIWLSSQSGTATHQTSSLLTAALLEFLGISAVYLADADHILRTAAHLFLFFILDCAVYSMAWVTQPCQNRAALSSGFICLIMAVTDEVKKIFIAGRHLSWEEMGLNCIGAAAGICVALYCVWRSTRRIEPMNRLHAGRPELL